MNDRNLVSELIGDKNKKLQLRFNDRKMRRILVVIGYNRDLRRDDCAFPLSCALRHFAANSRKNEWDST